ncbi:MAG: amidohydrolase family protein, partial [Planctomycetota bacterium]
MLTIAGERIAAVGKGPATGRVEDLGNVAVLPGLVNAHTHLDLSDLSGPLGEPGMAFVDWIRRVMESRLGRPPGRPVEEGLRECVRLGTTTLGEIAQPGWPAEQIDRARL